MSIRTLQYYDTIGLLKPDGYTASGYRLYDDTALERLQQILLFKELEFPLKEIKRIIDAPDFDRDKALSQQIELLTMKKGQTQPNGRVCQRGKKTMGQTAEYKEYEEKTKNQSSETQKTAWKNLMLIFVEFGKIKNKEPGSKEVQLLEKTYRIIFQSTFINVPMRS